MDPLRERKPTFKEQCWTALPGIICIVIILGVIVFICN